MLSKRPCSKLENEVLKLAPGAYGTSWTLGELRTMVEEMEGVDIDDCFL